MKVRATLLLLVFISIIMVSCSNKAELDTPIGFTNTRSVLYIGPLAGFNKALHTVDLRSFAEDPLCPSFSSGDDNGYFFGVGMEVPFAAKDNRHSITVKLMYNSMPSFFKVEDDKTYPSFLVGKDNDTLDRTVLTGTRNTLEVKYSMITFEALYSFTPEPSLPVRIAIGPTFDFASTKTFSQKLDLLCDDPAVTFLPTQEAINKGYTYENNNKTIVVKSGDIEGSTSLRIGIKAGLEFPIDVKGLGMVIPSVFYNFGVTKLTSNDNWRVNALQIGVDIRFPVKNIFSGMF